MIGHVAVRFANARFATKAYTDLIFTITDEAIGGAHYGPVLVYLSKVADAATADGSSSFFKIYQDTWAKNSAGGGGSDDFWGTKDLNTNCGKMDVKIPADLAAGDYLLRAEAIALHSASGLNGAQCMYHPAVYL